MQRKGGTTMGRAEGKVAFISGVARGQGRSHAVRLAEEGADIIGFDICGPIDTVPYPLASLDDLAETVKLVEERGRRIVAQQADVRDLEAVETVFQEGLSELGRVDIILANAGAAFGSRIKRSGMEQVMRAWQDSIDVLLTGVVNTVAAALPTMMSQGDGGSIVITSSTAGLKSMTGPVHSAEEALALGYTAAKHGVVGVMRSLAGSLAHLSIRVNTVHPGPVNTPLIMNDYFAKSIAEQARPDWQNPMPVDVLEPVDISNAIVWLCSEEARYVTGVMLPVDAGFLIK
jgi:SDR family mycofactocin-dependent oxidoreductase